MSWSRVVRAPRGAELSCLGWPQESAMRMLMNNLDPEVAERPADLVVYGGNGPAGAPSGTHFGHHLATELLPNRPPPPAHPANPPSASSPHALSAAGGSACDRAR